MKLKPSLVETKLTDSGIFMLQNFCRHDESEQKIKRVNLKDYLKSIEGLILPGRFSPVTKRFIDYVVDSENWQKEVPTAKNPGINVLAFNFYIDQNATSRDYFQNLSFF